MSYRGIKRILGESSLERKIRFWFGVCMFILIGLSFWSVNRITENLIYRNTRDQANAVKSNHILRSHLKELKGFAKNDKQNAAAGLFELLATEPASVPYFADVVVLDANTGRNQIPGTKVKIATEANEVRRLTELVDRANELQREQDQLAALKETDPKAYQEKLVQMESEPSPDSELVESSYSDGKNFYYYAPLIFRSQSDCLGCHFPVSNDPDTKQRLAEIQTLLGSPDTTSEQTLSLNLERYSSVPPMFWRITLDNKTAQEAITQSQAILLSVALITAVLSMLLLWLIVRRYIVQPLAHLRDVTEEVGHGRMDVRAEINTGDEFEELSRSFNRMLRHLMDTQLALQEANRDLDGKVDEQAQLNLKLYEMNQVKSEFLANMSHELRTPLNSIIGFSEILESSKGTDDKQKRFASNIRNSGRSLLDLINDILDLAKLEARKMEVKPTEFNIHQMIDELCEMVRNLAQKKNIRLVYDTEDRLPDLMQDKVKVRQVLTNLLSNAIKFTPEGGRINVDLKRHGDKEIQIKVRDTGVGIAESDQQIVFEKFRQGPSAIGHDALTREVSGTGLGLSIVKELCILLGGKIELESEVGKGSTFTVTLPWNFRQLPKINSEITETIDELTKNQRIDMARLSATPPAPTQEEIEASSEPKP
jgi:signal transduction histidine kinase